MSAEIVKAGPQGLGIQSYTDMDAAIRIFAQAGHKPADLALKLAVGAGLGMSLAQAVSDVYIIEGRPSLSATTQLTLIRRAGVKTSWIRSDREAATLRITLPGDEPVDTTYTIEDARACGIAGRKQWASHADAMLRARCITKAIRMHCPEMLGCNLYDPDEMERPEPARREAPQQVIPGGETVAVVDVVAEPVPPARPAPSLDERRDLARSFLDKRGALTAVEERIGGPIEGWDERDLDDVREIVREMARVERAAGAADVAAAEKAVQS